jgi:hypothetical protein
MRFVIHEKLKWFGFWHAVGVRVLGWMRSPENERPSSDRKGVDRAPE